MLLLAFLPSDYGFYITCVVRASSFAPVPVLVYAFQVIAFVLPFFIGQSSSGPLFSVVSGFPEAVLLTCVSFLSY